MVRARNAPDSEAFEEAERQEGWEETGRRVEEIRDSNGKVRFRPEPPKDAKDA
jgi:hypothetical protein